MRITVDRSISSNGVPAAAPPKGADSRVLHARYRSVDSARIARSLTSERVQTPSSPPAAGGRPKRQPAQTFSTTRGELETRQLHGNTTDKARSRRRGRPSGPPTAVRPLKGVGNEASSVWQYNGQGMVHAVGVAPRGPRRPTGRQPETPCPGWTTEGRRHTSWLRALWQPHRARQVQAFSTTRADLETGVHLHGNTTDKAWFMPSGSPLGAPDGRPAVDTILRARGGRPKGAKPHWRLRASRRPLRARRA